MHFLIPFDFQVGNQMFPAGAEEAAAARRRGIRLAEEHLRINAEDARAVYCAANGMVALGQRERGCQWARRALEMRPQRAHDAVQRRLHYAVAGSIEPAIDCLERPFAPA